MGVGLGIQISFNFRLCTIQTNVGWEMVSLSQLFNQKNKKPNLRIRKYSTYKIVGAVTAICVALFPIYVFPLWRLKDYSKWHNYIIS